jgi:hypothetical protein
MVLTGKRYSNIDYPSRLKYQSLGLYLFIVKENIVVALAIKRRVDVNQIHGLICNAIAQYVEAIAKVECIHGMIDE